jgi:superfamily II helicase
VKCELKQLFHEKLNALLPVKTLPVDEVALRSHMFVTVKHTATGAYDKM